MRPGEGRRDEYPDHRSGWAAAGTACKRRRPGPASLVIGGSSRSLGAAARKPHRHSAGVRQPPAGGADTGRMVTAVAADDLERAGVAAPRLALNDAGWPAPQDPRPAMSGLITDGCSSFGVSRPIRHR